MTRIDHAGASRFRVNGDMTFATVRELLAESKPLFENAQRLKLDLSAVNRTDSAGLALLLEWISVVEGKGGKVALEGLPESLLAIARLCQMETTLKSLVVVEDKPPGA